MSLKHRLNQIKYYLNRYGFWKTVVKCIKRAFGIKDAPLYTDSEAYEKWIEHNEPDGKALREMASTNFEIKPLISVVVPMYNTNEQYFSELIDCMQKQIYTNWELCLADGSEK